MNKIGLGYVSLDGQGRYLKDICQIIKLGVIIFKKKQRHSKRKISILLEYDKRDGERNVCRSMSYE